MRTDVTEWTVLLAHQLSPQYPQAFPASLANLKLLGPPACADGEDKEENEEWGEDGHFLEA